MRGDVIDTTWRLSASGGDAANPTARRPRKPGRRQPLRPSAPSRTDPAPSTFERLAVPRRRLAGASRCARAEAGERVDRLWPGSRGALDERLRRRSKISAPTVVTVKSERSKAIRRDRAAAPGWLRRYAQGKRGAFPRPRFWRLSDISSDSVISPRRLNSIARNCLSRYHARPDRPPPAQTKWAPALCGDNGALSFAIMRH